VYRQIAIALDGSPAALTAVAFARHINAESYRIIHVTEPLGSFGWASRPETHRAGERAALAERYRADALAAMTAPGSSEPDIPISVDLRFGDPADELIAASDAADMMLLTTRGRGIAERTLFGSVADEVSRRGVRPTLILRPDHDLRHPERIVVPLDGGPRAERAIPVARRLALTLRCPIVLVHVVDEEDLAGTPFGAPGPKDGVVSPKHNDINRAIDQAAGYLEDQERALETAELSVQHRVVIGDTIPALIEFADPADIVVVASRAHTGIRRLVDQSVAEQLVRHAPSPVMIVHDRTLSTQDPGPATMSSG
jgi:nucleotide-binding universal stress UspA family protein